ncbi:DNA primase [Allorhizocola rhizosphaerae]|uniref:DNA primase n=1 Tax=Allorhizocola rhizosphaerae TaxID=1872709 RepID=UPI000E3DAC6F|nr:DNA primase [Allorhizocola rhizosphaerae]
MATIWEEFELSPIEVALPGNKVGFTLRGYRMESELTPTDISEREDEDDVFSGRDARAPLDDEELPEFEWTKEALDEVAAAPAEDQLAEEAVESKESTSSEESAADEGEEKKPADQEVPIFLSHKGKLLLFKTAEGLASFVKSKAPHDMKQLKDWSKFASKLKASDIEVSEDESYELDLVVENLRGGPDAWEPPLLLSAGEIARDLAYALQLKKVIISLAPGSPLDDLDEALRATGFFARRRLKKIGTEQASISWRSIIGKISASVDWRD